MRIAEERTFAATDGTNLFYRHWPACAVGEKRKAIILLHRGHEHSGRVQHLVDELELPEFAIFGWDARGHGLSRSADDGNPGFSTFVSDVELFVRHVSEFADIPIEDIALTGQSVGAVLAAAWVHDYAPRIRCLVLAAPAFHVKLYVPFARTGLRLAAKFSNGLRINSYVKASALTHDAERIASYNSDPLIQRPISARVLLGLYSTAERVIEDAQAIRVPTQLLISGRDFVVSRRPQDRFFERLGSPVKERHVFDDFFHDTLGERDRRLPIARAREFLLRMFSQSINRQTQIGADREGFTKREFDSLLKPLPVLSVKGASFAFTRFAMRTGGQLSEGIRLGLKTGFDSGSTLDYIYRNRASGISLAGKAIDRAYIDSIGWRGIRARRQNIENLLLDAMERLRDAGQPVRIVDIAAGHGRYVLDAVERSLRKPDNVLLRDYSELNVAGGRAMIEARKLGHLAQFEQGDAFDRGSLAILRPRPTVAVVSGLYELFPENAGVQNSLAGLAKAMERGGYLVYTGQPWHPQLETIARVLPSHRGGQPWVMRRRTQGELDDLVEGAGFRKLSQRIDEWGIFTVSLAERV